MLVEQADADERHGHVAGGLDVVAGEDAEAAGVDAEALVEAVLGAEVGDRAGERRAVLAVEPVLAAAGHVAVELGQDLGVLGHEGRVVEQLRPGDRLRQDLDGIAVARPRQAVDSAEERPGPGIPAHHMLYDRRRRPSSCGGSLKEAPGRVGTWTESSICACIISDVPLAPVGAWQATARSPAAIPATLPCRPCGWTTMTFGLLPAEGGCP